MTEGQRIMYDSWANRLQKGSPTSRTSGEILYYHNQFPGDVADLFFLRAFQEVVRLFATVGRRNTQSAHSFAKKLGGAGILGFA